MKTANAAPIVAFVALLLSHIGLLAEENAVADSETESRIDVEIRRFGLGPGSWHIYSSIGVSPAGEIYIGVCDYSFAQELSDALNGAVLVRYDPVADRMQKLGDMQDVTGQRKQRTAYPQTKIHTPILFSESGKAYFGTHSVERDYLPGERRDLFKDGYPGGHWISYEPSTGVFEDLGIAAAGESLMGSTLDSKRKRLYATTHEMALLVEYDMRTGISKQAGSIGNYPTRMMTCLSDGNVYTCDERGFIVRYDPDAGSIDRLDLRIPTGGYEADLVSIFALCTEPAGNRFFGISTLIDEVTVKNVIKGGYLFEYTIRGGESGTLRNLGSASASNESVVSETGLYHAMTQGKDGKVYWSAPEKDSPVHLMSYDPGTGRKSDLGAMYADGEDTHVRAVYAACTGKDGKLYLAGLLDAQSDAKWENEAVLIVHDPKSRQ